MKRLTVTEFKRNPQRAVRLNAVVQVKGVGETAFFAMATSYYRQFVEPLSPLFERLELDSRIRMESARTFFNDIDSIPELPEAARQTLALRFGWGRVIESLETLLVDEPTVSLSTLPSCYHFRLSAFDQWRELDDDDQVALITALKDWESLSYIRDALGDADAPWHSATTNDKRYTALFQAQDDSIVIFCVHSAAKGFYVPSSVRIK